MERPKVTKVQEMVHELKVSDVMTRQPVTVGPRMQMRELRNLLSMHRISGLPVVKDDVLVGVISLEDFIKSLADRQNGCAVEEKMSKNVESLYDDDPLVRAIAKFETTNRGRYPVIERKSGKLVGIITKGDVIEGLLKKLEIEYHEEEIHRYRASHIFEDIEADDTRLVFQYTVKGQDFKRAGEGSSRLKRTLMRLGIHPDVVRRVAIASYEAEMNLVIYTEGGLIRVRVQPSKIELMVKDEGPGIENTEQALQPGYSTAPDWVRELGFGAGMGLPNIKNMSDEFQLKSELGQGTSLKASFLTTEDEHETS